MRENDRKGRHLDEFGLIIGEQIQLANPDYEMEP